MGRQQGQTFNDREAIREHGRPERERKRVRSMQRVEAVALPAVGQSYVLAGYGTVKVKAARKGSVTIKYKKGNIEKETTVHPDLFNL